MKLTGRIGSNNEPNSIVIDINCLDLAVKFKIVHQLIDNKIPFTMDLENNYIIVHDKILFKERCDIQ